MKRVLSVILALVLALSLAPCAFAASGEAIEAANALHDLGLFGGVGTNADGSINYDLDRAPTRNEAITMLVRLLGKEDEAKAGTWNIPFTDVADWAKPYVGYAYANGLTSGTGDTTFGGDTTVTASQYLTFVLRALGYESGADFQWDRAWELSDMLGITQGQYNASSAFLRGDIAIISNNALDASTKNESATLRSTLGLGDRIGQFLPVKKITGGHSPTATVYGYDAKGNRTEVVDYDMVIDNISRSTYSYNEAGEIISSYYTEDDLPDYYRYSEYTYDERGNVLSETTTQSNGYSSATTYTYDEQGNAIAETETWSHGYSSTTTYTYDDQDNVLSETTTQSNGYSSTTTYTYDEQGNVIAETETWSNGSSCTTTYTYDEQGNVLSERYIPSNVSSYTYDDQGNVIAEFGILLGSSYTTIYTYNDQGNVFSETATWSDGDTSTTTYEYQQFRGQAITPEPYKIMYALDGRTQLVPLDAVADNQAVDWYLYQDYIRAKVYSFTTQDDWLSAFDFLSERLFRIEAFGSIDGDNYKFLESEWYSLYTAWQNAIGCPVAILNYSVEKNSERIPEVTITFKNLTDKTIIRMDCQWTCLDAYGDATTDYPGTSNGELRPWSEYEIESYGQVTWTWTLKNNTHTFYIDNLHIEGVAFSDGTSWRK